MSWGRRYLGRVLGRNLGRSLLSLLLAALLAFAFGVLTVLRGMYGELFQRVEVKPVFTGLPYSRAQKVEASGYVRDACFEFVAQAAVVEMNDTALATVILTNRLDDAIREKVDWAEGWNEEAFFGSNKAVCVMNAEYAGKLGKGLGDRVRVNERDWLSKLSQDGSPFQPGETLEELRDRKRPFLTIAGLIRGEPEDHTLYVPTEANYAVHCLYTGNFTLDIARYTLNDYFLAAEFRDYAKSIVDGVNENAAFTMDTSYADRIYRIHQLIETLYPLTIAAALLLGGVLPGLTVLHASKELSILRALGTKTGKCVSIYTLAQVLCALVGLVLGMVLVILIRKPELGAVWKPFGLYLAAHLAACAIGSGVFAWLCARKRVLEQLQAKE